MNEYTYAVDALSDEIRQLSPASADCIEQIRAKYGVRAAYLAAIALVIYREGLTRSGRSPSKEDLKGFVYYSEMRETAETIRLYEEAAGHLLSRSNRIDDLFEQ